MTQEEQRAAIIEGLTDGRSLRAICRGEGMPTVTTVMRWCAADEEWCEQYARARQAGDDAMAEDIQEISDRADLDPNDKKVRIDARKWLLAKRQPRKYGDKIDVTSGGEKLQTEVDEATRAVRLAALAKQINLNRGADAAD